ncbi:MULTISPECIES: SDR family NAD(P)-dependent oxidoreductase [Rhodococcus]|uniref:SDR family NAD(P)-dependent oxidoreductase n=1 Tax=Rhodococcus oxybenzonivorans TaxID=1990687 RepID=A0AAE5A7D4_9NOCA|nr:MULTISPECIES: SDR family NAD(P)-dependent oxidoreductase [Rhodococcus]MDV7241852.1 SDR family NAD(P)-dependent oxidoreductase [Rhodococcus oxybenzonivorans]MDV7265494.1 SDR family NAD(P)-dependent oxidoreductase [Rhodococcus oxybenzonivorans]MDV7273614.1 SDR family NAD(P)-dependent oxidoreductase [Rhodococcus oxybenzonivorans]MDV7334134.1 SDR family NAD(P)-dependent oxidoreductase [Rhodococcus oxybenzonivorans]MDV7343553.1 SDR family NAD(P)-dependent oxidoreductase [Rhodococcus oxybenzonivo
MNDKVVVITGAGSGLGREGAVLFAAEGAQVVISDVVQSRAEKVVEEIGARGGTAVAAGADVRVEADMNALVDVAVGTFGRVDVMWGNAGIPEPGFGMQPLAKSALEDWNNIFAVNVTGIYLAWRAAARWMIDAGRPGTLLATSSAASFTAYPGFPMYTASKAAVNGLVRAAALEFGKFGIRANALCPTHGMSVNFALPPEADVLGKSYEEMQPWNPDNRAMPLRLDQPPVLRDNANLALFLASDESRYMSGLSIASTDGGQFARTSIVFPTDLGRSDDITSGSVPVELREQIDR